MNLIDERLRNAVADFVFDHMPDGVVVLDRTSHHVVLRNAAAAAVLERGGSTSEDLLIDDLLRTPVGADGDAPVRDIHVRCGDGPALVFEATMRGFPAPGVGDGDNVMAFLRDVTDTRRAADDRAQMLETMTLLLDSSGQPTFAVDLEGRCTFANRAAERALGYARGELRGHTMHAVMHHSYPDGSPYPDHECAISDAFRAGASVHIDDEVFWCRDGTPFASEYRSEPILVDGCPKGAVVTFADVTDRRRAEAELAARQRETERLAATDALTGIGNRRHAQEVLDSLEAGDAVALIDIDHFKSVNDRLGHSAGDELLVEFARHLAKTVRLGDTVARYGGEEFLAVLRSAGVGAVETIERIGSLWSLTGCPTFSAGVAVHTQARSGSETLDLADAALYAAKRGGRNRVVLSDDDRLPGR